MKISVIGFGSCPESHFQKYLKLTHNTTNLAFVKETNMRGLVENSFRATSSLFKDNFLLHAQMDTMLETVSYGKKPDLEGRHLYGYIQLDENGDVEKIIRRTNPNGYFENVKEEVEGSWSKYFILKSGDRAHFALKSDIDFEMMEELAAEKASQIWRLGRKSGEETNISKESFIDHYRESAAVPFAWIDLEGNINIQVDVSNEAPSNKFYSRMVHATKFNSYLKELPDNTLLTVFSCDYDPFLYEQNKCKFA